MPGLRCAFIWGMNVLNHIRSEIDDLSARRVDLWHTLSAGRNPEVMEAIKQIDERLGQLWDEHRAERARIRFGEREAIVKRARAEERLERAA